MKLTLLKSIISVLLFASVFKLSAQTISGPTSVCPGVANTYTIPALGSYGGKPEHAAWTPAGTTVSGQPAQTTRSISFTSSGPITVDYSGWDIDNGGFININEISLNVTVKTAGTITGAPSIACPSSSIVLTNIGSVGSSFAWQSSPSGQNNWSTFYTSGQTTTLGAPVGTQSTDYRIVSNDCPSAVTPTVTVPVYTGISSPGSITGNISVCAGNYSPAIYEASAANCSGGCSYQWQSRVNSGGWTNINGAVSSIYAPGILSQTTDFQRLAVWNCNSATTAVSNFVTVIVNPQAVGGNLISNNGGFCQNGTVNLSLSGQTGSISWFYTYNENGANYGPYQINGSGTTNSLAVTNDGIHTRSYYFYCTLSSGACSSVYSSTLQVNVYPPSVGGTASSLNGTSFCQSGNVEMTVTGYTGVTEWYYQYSDDGINYNSPTQVPSSYGKITLYVPVTTDGIHNRTYSIYSQITSGTCSLANSTPVLVNVYPTSQGGSLSSSDGTTFCSGGTVGLSLSGYIGNIIGWYYQYNDGGGWSSWAQFSTSNSPSNSFALSTNSSVNRSYQFYAQVQSGVCSAVNSSVLGVTVYQNTLAGNLSVNQNSLCSSGNVSLTVSGNYGSITRYMISSKDNSGAWSSWSSTTSAPALSTSAGINRTYQFQAFVQNGSCAEVGTNIVTTVVYPTTTIGTFAASPATICSSGTVTLSASSLFDTSVTWQFRYSDNGGSTYTSWSNVSTALTSPQTYAATSGSGDRLYQFQVIAQNGSCAPVTSATASVTVKSAATGTIAPSLVEAFAPVNANYTLSGYAPTATLLWQQSPNGTTWSSATGPNTLATYTGTSSGPGVSISTTTKYRVQVTNGSCINYSAVLPVIISQVPSIRSTMNPAYLAAGNSLKLKASFNNGSKYYSYQWIKGGVDIPGATDSLYTAIEPSAYTLRVKASATSTTSVSNAFNIYAVGLQPDNTVNALVTTVVLTSGVNENTDLYTLPNGSISQSVQYLDLQSRPVQTVAIGQSPLQKDIVQPYSYDTLAPTTYLPYVASTKDGSRRITAINNGGYTNSDQYYFYQNTTTKTATSTAPYAKTVYDNSPIARVIEQGAPGTDWQTGTSGSLGAHTVKPVFHASNSTFKVRTWTTAGPTGYYAAMVLAVNRVTDENGNPVMTYTDKLGRTVLKRVKTSVMPDTTTWLETYYVYNTRGNLALQVPPKVSSMLNNGTAWSTTLRDTWCFVYTYDVRNRLVQKQVPGAAVVYYVYDPLGRLVLTQDGKLRSTNQWAFVKYDIKGRTVMSGLYTNATQTTLATVQTLVNALYPTTATPWYEDRGTTLHGYTNQSWPMTNADASALQILSVNYFDNYDFDYNGSADYTYTTQGITGEQTQGNSFGLATGSKRLVMGTSNWLYSYVFYDRLGRVIQTRSNNHLSLTVDNLTTVGYDFEGKALQTKTYHNAGGTNQYTILQTPTYDNQGRVLYLTHQVNSSSPQVVAQYQYNELGQVVTKQLHGTGGGNFMQNVDYRYNIRGWLSSINNAQLTSDNGITNSDTNDYFGMELFYNNAETSSLGNTPYYNGNVGAIKWKSAGVAAGTADQRSYLYAYDKSDKLTAATFQANTGSAWTKESGTLNETMSYDKNGNILTMQRNQNQRGLSGATITSATQSIDNLTYTYAFGNQLSKVTDAATTTGGFVDGANATTEYTYNANGNLTADQNKGIDSIKYNVLGKATRIKFHDGRLVTYTYDASGSKLTMAATVSGVATTTNYVGGFVYNTNSGTSALNFFSSPEGRVVKNTSGNFEYQYAIADHQGNTRVLFTSAAQTAVPTLADFDGDVNDQESQFQNVPAPIPYTAANHTPGGSYVVRMNQGNPVGPALSKKVFAGDVINMEVYSYYEAESGFGTTSAPLTGIITSVAGAFGGVSGAPDYTGQIYSGVNSALSGIGTGANQGDNAPAAFLNYILFDKNYKVMTAGWKKVVGTSFAKQYDSIANIRVKEAGYFFAYLSYEDQSNNWVYFDDFKVTITPSNILQSNEYYPFGLQTANSWTRDNAVTNNFLANGGTELNTTSALYDLEFRNFDPILGRMNQVDPMADKYSSHTPYNFAFNRPNMVTDVNGADPIGEGRMFYPGGRSPYINWHIDENHEGQYYNSGYYDMGMYGDIGGGGSGDLYDPYGDAAKVNSGQMTQDEYVAKYKETGAPSNQGVIGYLFSNISWSGGLEQEGSASIYSKGAIVASVYGTWQESNGGWNDYTNLEQIDNRYSYLNSLFDGTEYRPGSWNQTCGACLNTATVGQNIAGLTYPGGNNPLSYNLKDNFSYVPKNRAEYPAIGHDRRYSNLGTKGLNGLLTDTRAIGADWLFVAEEMNIANDPSQKFSDRTTAYFLGIGLGGLAYPKTMYQLVVDPLAIPMWFGISNGSGVTNTPSK